ncbi:MAG: Hsp20/alpha crystallin family protein [Anaerolineales bacterium]
MTAHKPRRTGPLEEAALMEALFSGFPANSWLVERRGRVWRPPTDMYETEDQIVVQVEVAGVRQEDFSVSLYDRRLSISGVRGDSNPDRRAYHQMEIHFGEFRTDVELPCLVNENQIEARYSDGFLRVTLPKLKPQHIPINK